MSETEWMDGICSRLDEGLKKNYSRRQIQASSRRRLPYRFEISSYNEEKPNPGQATSYQTDLLIVENNSDGSWTPRVVIEGKLGQVTTHDSLTYSAKAATHVQVHPYLRYGILIGALPYVPLRLFRHGSHFDFMITWSDELPNPDEWQYFENLIMEEIEASRQLQNFIESKRVAGNYRIVRRKLLLEGLR